MDTGPVSGNVFLSIPRLNNIGNFHHFISSRRYVGDVSRVEGRKRILEILELEENAIIRSCQVHSNRVHVVSHIDIEENSFLSDMPSFTADALVTNVKNIYLAIFVADCVPLFIIDPVQCCLAVVHAGWRGVASRVHVCAVETLGLQYGSLPRNLRVGIGPYIKSCCFEVEEDVVVLLSRKNVVTAEPREPGKWMVDLGKVIKHDLISQGVTVENIKEMKYCTSCRRDMFFSHRGEGGQTGRFLLGAGITGKNGAF